MSAEPFWCRSCGASHGKSILTYNYEPLKQTYELIQCGCGCIGLHPVPTDEELAKVYPEQYWRRGADGCLATVLYALRMHSLVRMIIRRYTRDAAVLDWGCGDGAFLSLLHQSGMTHVCGIDTFAGAAHGMNVHKADLCTVALPLHTVDVITCFHTLEHIKEVSASLRKAAALLKPGGMLVIEVPNVDSWGFRLFRTRWQPLEIPSHVNFFTPAVLKRLVTASGDFVLVSEHFYSARASAAAWVLSLFPSLSPRRFRAHDVSLVHRLWWAGVYALMQLLVMPAVWISALFKKGCIMRLVFTRATTPAAVSGDAVTGIE